jgi:DDE superfamily endonuclease
MSKIPSSACTIAHIEPEDLPQASLLEGAERFVELLDNFRHLFTHPSYKAFSKVVIGWALGRGRRTVTKMIRAGDPGGEHAHDAFHRLLRDGVWDMDQVWRQAIEMLIKFLSLTGRLILHVDDTLLPKSGRKVQGAGKFRDAVLSTKNHTVIRLGLNVIVLSLCVTNPYTKRSLSLPICSRVFYKQEAGKEHKTHCDLVREMLAQVLRWFPQFGFVLCDDGAYASLAADKDERVQVVSRIRCDAALNLDPEPRQRGQRGRPALRGERLPSPSQVAQDPSLQWESADIDIRGRSMTRQLVSYCGMWHKVCGTALIQLVLVRDPAEIDKHDFFFSTDLAMPACQIVTVYASRWSIEESFRDVKQHLGAAQPQSWKRQGPARAAALSFWLYSLSWLWHLLQFSSSPTWRTDPWFTRKKNPSFADVLATLAQSIWTERIFPNSASRADSPKILRALLQTVSQAA